MIYIETNSMDPYYNFALEYYLLTEKEMRNDIIFMLWRTNPTLMIGKHQNTLEEINTAYAKEHDIHIVRRITGGGTIYTEAGGWQFSFINPNGSQEIDFSLYTTPIVNALVKMGVDAYANGRNDLMIDGKKFSGNAQCRLNHFVLHHGSLLFDTNIEAMVRAITVDEDKIISKGIKSVKERVCNIRDFLSDDIDVERFKELLVLELLGEDGHVYTLTEEEIKRVHEIATEKFRSWDWNYGKSPNFNLTRAKRFSGGKISFHLFVKKGLIEECEISGDFFENKPLHLLIDQLKGCRYEKETLRKRLKEISADEYFFNITADELTDCMIS